MKPSKFTYINAQTLDQALKALQLPEAKLIAGGQSLVPLMNYRLSQPSIIVDINSIKELSTISTKDKIIEIGSLVTHNAAIESKILKKHFPIIPYAFLIF